MKTSNLLSHFLSRDLSVGLKHVGGASPLGDNPTHSTAIIEYVGLCLTLPNLQFLLNTTQTRLPIGKSPSNNDIARSIAKMLTPDITTAAVADSPTCFTPP